MISITALKSIAILLLSLLVGVVFFFMTSNLPKASQKKRLNEILSLLINFVIYIWIGKIITNFTVFITDPLAILAYPSDSQAFYVATLLLIINLAYRKLKHKEDITVLIQTFIPVFLGGSFIFEFIKMFVDLQMKTWINLSFTLVILILYLFIYDRFSEKMSMYVVGFSWVVGQVILSIFFNASIYGYRLVPAYFIILLIIVVLAIIYQRPKENN